MSWSSFYVGIFYEIQPVVWARVRRVGVRVVLAPLLGRLRHLRGRGREGVQRVERIIPASGLLFSFALFTFDQNWYFEQS